MTTTTDRPHCVYRCYNAAGGLLYVGMTSNLPRRLGEHAGDKPWWPSVARIDVERVSDEVAARNAEQAAMDSESPKHNLSRSVGKTPIRGFRVPDDLWEAVLAQAAAEGTDVSKLTRLLYERYLRAKPKQRKDKP